MKNLALLIGLLSLLISSCGTHNALRYVKTNPNQEIVQTQTSETPAADFIPSTEVRVSDEQIISNQPIDQVTEEKTSETATYPDTTLSAEQPEMSSDEAQDAVEQAVRTERKAKTSKVLGIVGLSTSILSFLAFISVILMILSLIFYISANRARYNTEKGVKALKAAKVLLFIYGGLLALGIFILAIAILLFL